MAYGSSLAPRRAIVCLGCLPAFGLWGFGLVCNRIDPAPGLKSVPLEMWLARGRPAAFLRLPTNSRTALRDRLGLNCGSVGTLEIEPQAMQPLSRAD